MPIPSVNLQNRYFPCQVFSNHDLYTHHHKSLKNLRTHLGQILAQSKKIFIPVVLKKTTGDSLNVIKGFTENMLKF